MNELPRVIIAAAGEAKRFKAFIPKHLVEIDGEKLICRTIRQLMALGFKDIVLMANGGWTICDFPVTRPVKESIFP